MERTVSIKLKAPNGARIRGSAEEAIGVAYLSRLGRRKGEVSFDYEGTTDGLYETQRTVEWQGDALFEDGGGNWWRETRLVPLRYRDDPQARPDVPLHMLPSIGDALELRAENAKLRALLAAVVAVPQAAPWLCMAPAVGAEGGLHQQISAVLSGASGS